MKRVLVLAYYYPPLGGAGVQRTVKFLRFLPEFGYEATVLTGPEQTSLSWAPPDSSLAEDVPAATTRLVRLEHPEPPRSTGLQRRAESWFRLEKPWGRWWKGGLVDVGRLLDGGIDLIYASMAPWESGEAAATLARELDLPWVADLRDPWALDEWNVYPSAIHRRLERARMGRTLSAADAIVMNTAGAAAALVDAFPELEDRPIAVIPNGFDSTDFAAAPLYDSDEHFRIVHAGYGHTEFGRSYRRTRFVRQLLGGATRGLDVLSRSHVYLLQAVSELREEHPGLRDSVQVHLAGVLSAGAQESLPRDFVTAHGYLPHDVCTALLKSADLLFLPMHDLPRGHRALAVPGKTYEYLAVRRPILAALPDGDARDLVARSGVGRMCLPRDVAGMKRIILEQYERSRQGEDDSLSDEAFLLQYERSALAARLVAVFDQVLSGGRAPAIASVSGS